MNKAQAIQKASDLNGARRGGDIHCFEVACGLEGDPKEWSVIHWTDGRFGSPDRVDESFIVVAK